MEEQLTFSNSQQVAFDAAQTKKNIFITGSGGNGKSYLTKALTNQDTLVIAPTGIAALNVNGTTCHRAFGLPIGLPEFKDKNTVSPKVAQILRATKRIIISEIGMVRADYFELMDKKARLATGIAKPFGGIQTIVEGDFFQLEPIVSNREWDLFYTKNEHPFAFGSKSWKFDMYELTDPQRHPNIDHYNLLNKLRVGDSEALPELLGTTQELAYSGEVINLCCFNSDADNINNYFYSQNKNTEYVFNGRITGNFNERDCPVSLDLRLKVGCKVMICSNDIGGTYVNGDKGVLEKITPMSIEVRLENGSLVNVEQFSWETYSYKSQGSRLSKEVTGSFTQFPIRLGWAISIHKSQGLTLDSAVINIGKGCFSHGQFYVAVSRVKDLNNVYFKDKSKITKENLIVREEVKQFYGR